MWKRKKKQPKPVLPVLPEEYMFRDKEECAEFFEAMAEALSNSNVASCRHISRRDNNWVFEVPWKLKDIADRIRDEYNEPDDY